MNPDQKHFLIAPFGLLFSEVTASSLVRTSTDPSTVEFIPWLYGCGWKGWLPCHVGEAKLRGGDSGPGQHQPRRQHSWLHPPLCHLCPAARCEMHRPHTHSRRRCGRRTEYKLYFSTSVNTLPCTYCGVLLHGLQVSTMKCGLLPISPEALSLGEVAYHDYYGILVNQDEKVVLQKNLGADKKVTAHLNHHPEKEKKCLTQKGKADDSSFCGCCLPCRFSFWGTTAWWLWVQHWRKPFITSTIWSPLVRSRSVTLSFM